MAKEIEKRNEAFLIYQDENGLANVTVRFEGDDVWLLQEQIMELFDASRQDVSYHINQIYAEGEQDLERTRKNFLIVRQEGARSVKRNMFHYNLDMIIAVGYRVKSQVATRFRQWATERLHEYIVKGFALDDERLNRQVLDLYATAVDYAPRSETSQLFFKIDQPTILAVRKRKAAIKRIHY